MEEKVDSVLVWSSTRTGWRFSFLWSIQSSWTCFQGHVFGLARRFGHVDLPFLGARMKTFHMVKSPLNFAADIHYFFRQPFHFLGVIDCCYLYKVKGIYLPLNFLPHGFGFQGWRFPWGIFERK